MAFIIIISILMGMVITYFFLNPADKIKSNELTEFETLSSGYGAKIETLLTSGDINSTVVERYFYLKHKYNLLSKNKTKN